MSSFPSAQHSGTGVSTSADVEGLRCEVRSMRSVPHALYTLPSVSHVLTAYVRQLVMDFSRSLLLCRRRRHGWATTAEAATTAAAAPPIGYVEEEETYLLLRLCAYEARRRRRQQHASETCTKSDDDSEEDCDALWSGQSNATEGQPGGSKRHARAVEAQLFALLAEAEEARLQHSQLCGSGPDDISASPLSAAASGSGMPLSVTPPLLSSLLRFKPLLHDMQLLSQHLLLPRHAWPHHQREWVSVYEDVSVTLRDRLMRCRASPTLWGITDLEVNADAERAAAARETHRREFTRMSGHLFPADELVLLWHTLWDVLGAAWRQRDRLWGAYRYLQGPRRLPPLSLNGQVARAVPPGVHASPLLRDQFTRHLVHTATAASGQATDALGLPPTLVHAHDEDSCAFGPFTSAEVGISSERCYVLRQPLAAVLRSLQVCVPQSGRDALVTSTSAFAGFTYVNAPSPRRASGGAVSPSSSPVSTAHHHSNATASVVVPLFDLTEEDVQLATAVPYLSPEVYVAQRHCQQAATTAAASAGRRQRPAALTPPPPAHSFSDDVWNVAVVVMEAALSGFAVLDPAQCHLAHSPAASRVGTTGASRVEASPDAVPPSAAGSEAAAATAASPGYEEKSPSVYVDVMRALAKRHRLSQTAAHNFLYAALHHLPNTLRQPPSVLSGGREEAVVGQGVGERGPSPAQLAQDWAVYLRSRYGRDFVEDVLAEEVAAKGLRWRRSERWNAFGLAHGTANHAATAATPTNAALGDAGPGPGSFNSAPQSPFSPLSATDSEAAAQTKDTASPPPPLQQQQQGSSCQPDSIGSMSVFSDDGSFAAGLSAALPGQSSTATTTYGPVNNNASGPIFLSATAPAGFASRTTSPTTQPASPLSGERASSRPQADAPLSVTLPGHPHPLQQLWSSSTVSSAVQSPLLLRGGNGRANSSSSTARVPQRLDRTVRSMDTPLLRLFGLSDSRAGQQSSSALWERLKRYLHHRTTVAVMPASSAVGGGGGATAAAGIGSPTGAGPMGKANGAVADAADVDSVDEVLRLFYTCLVFALRRAQNETAEDADDEAASCYAAMNHPFFRGVVERGLLATYMSVCGCRAGQPSTSSFGCSPSADAAATVLPALNLYMPAQAVLSAIEQLERRDKETVFVAAAPSRVQASVAALTSVDRVTRLTGTLRTLIGDDVRAWEAARDAARRTARRSSDGGAALFLRYAATSIHSAGQSPLESPPVRRTHQAVAAALTPLEFSLSAQLHHTAQLRRLMCASSAGATDGTDAAAQVRCYLQKTLMMPAENAVEEHGKTSVGASTAAPFFVIPPVIRGEVWGCLLHVPPPRKREALYTHAVHRTAATPSLNDRQLAVDIPRCHAYHPLLSTSTGSAQLQRILKAWLFQHPRYAYWQGLDSVCAVLLTARETDEALVLAQLNAVVEGFIAHDEDSCASPGGSRSSLLVSPHPHNGAAAAKPSMSEQLHRLTVVVRYCDPLLAHYLFDVLGCTPELYAISWLLTLFSHSLPTRKVYLLWDLLFVLGDSSGGEHSGSGSTCLVALCAAVITHKRAQLLSTDFSGCLSAFSSGASSLNVAAAVGDTRQVLRAVPPSVLCQPLADDTARAGANDALYGRAEDVTGAGAAARLDKGVAAAPTVALLSVDDLKAAWQAARRRTAAATSSSASSSLSCEHHWSDSGVYLVDLRPHSASATANTRIGDAATAAASSTRQEFVLGAIHLPLMPPSSAVFAPREGEGAGGVDAALFSSNVYNSQHRSSELQREDGVGAGWGLVEEQERLQAEQQQAREALERHIADAAAELVRHVGNPAMAAIVPRTADRTDPLCAAAAGSSVEPPWPVHPMVLKTSMAPHVVLLTSGQAGQHNGNGFISSFSGEAAAEELWLAHQLGVQLNACGVHNVSILRGGVASIRWLLPELVVQHTAAA